MKKRRPISGAHIKKNPETNQPPAIRLVISVGEIVLGFMKLTSALIPIKKPNIMQNPSHIDEMIANHQGRNRTLANKCVVTIKTRKGLKYSKNLGSKNGYRKTTRGILYQKRAK